jgi:hypothetical protein
MIRTRITFHKKIFRNGLLGRNAPALVSCSLEFDKLLVQLIIED